ncbi:hypothetical protein [Nocardioides sambongensis]|uniref:hypothetical protein n=1 Tax=Nocardioides sambongensis TaxID=2589074 RepID=UPI0018C87627|nr:hypothetical protein [Nocardioides sambongensis]
MTASALAPWAGAVLADASGGYRSAFLVLAIGAAVAAGLVVVTRGASRPAAVAPAHLSTDPNCGETIDNFF